MSAPGQPVAGRECGTCTVCCRVAPIDAPELKKQSGVLCRHCVESAGCTIHATRPQVCRESFCGWRLLPQLAEAWRPDLSKVLVLFEYDDIPPAYVERPGLKFLLTEPLRPAFQPAFAGYVAGLVDAGVPVFLSVPGPPGFFFAKAFLNDHLGPAVQARDGGRIVQILLSIADSLRNGAFERVTFGSN